MHDDFADWYRIASIDFTDVDLRARWAGVEAFAKDAAVPELLEAARLFYALPPKDLGFLTKFRAPFKVADEKFSMLDGNAELRVLAGAVLASLFASDDRGDAAALIITSGSFHGLRPAPVGDIVVLARRHLAERSAAIRELERIDLPDINFANQLQSVTQAMKSNANLQAAAEPVVQILQTIVDTLSGLRAWADSIDRERATHREESDVLWWLFGGHSRDLRLAFRTLKSPSACLIAAKELADLTASVPGPYAARAFLDKAIRDAHRSLTASVGLADAVGACPAEWLAMVMAVKGLEGLQDLCPVICAISRAAEVQGKDTWHDAFHGVTGLNATGKLDPLDLAEQAYQEWLLARVVNG